MSLNLWPKKKDTRAQLSEILGDAPLPTFPGLVLEVLSDLRDPDIPVRRIADRLKSEPSLTLRILKLANSGAYGTRRSIDDVAHAVVFLGRRSVESLVLSVAVRDVLPTAPAPGFDSSRFWRAAARRASAAQALANALHPRTANMSFTAALLQDMAVPLLAHRGRDDYGQVLEHWHQTGDDLASLETSEFGWNHADIAGWLCGEWDIPDTLGQAIAAHHDGNASAEQVPPAVHLVSLIQERSEDLTPLVEAARDAYMLAPDRTVDVIQEAFKQADALATLLAA